MGSIPICERCGLRAVRHELEKEGIILRFCDDCYWGELEAEGKPEVEARPEQGEPRPSVAGKPGKIA